MKTEHRRTQPAKLYVWANLHSESKFFCFEFCSNDKEIDPGDARDEVQVAPQTCLAPKHYILTLPATFAPFHSCFRSSKTKIVQIACNERRKGTVWRRKKTGLLPFPVPRTGVIGNTVWQSTVCCEDIMIRCLSLLCVRNACFRAENKLRCLLFVDPTLVECSYWV